MRGEARNARIELRVGEAPLGGEVDHRRLVRRAASEMGDPVVVANRQGLLQRYGGLAPPDLRDLTPFSPVEEAEFDTVLRPVAAPPQTPPSHLPSCCSAFATKRSNPLVH